MTFAENRKIEDKQMLRVKEPDNDKQDDKAIEKLIDDTLKKKHHVYLMTDWHLYKRDKKGALKCHKRQPAYSKILNNIKKKVTDDDVLIVLGDLVDGEYQDKENLIAEVKQLPGHKILTLGNNDLFDKSVYKKCGFEYVCEAFCWHNIIFSHVPINTTHTSYQKYDINCHGHIHDSRVYWVPYKNHIDVAYLGGRENPIDLHDINMKKVQEYSKLIREDQSHFNEGYDICYTNIFDLIQEQFIHDPFDDEE